MKNNIIDLYREYIRCHNMCSKYNDEHKTDIQPRECLQLKSATGEWVGYFSLDEPNFAELLDHKVRFAVAILTGKPIFIGETVYSPEGERYRVDGGQLTCMTGKYKNWCLAFIGADELGFLTEPPKKPRTFTLNGVELPMPKKEFSTNKVHLHMVDNRPPKVDEEIFFFETIDEAVAFYDGLREALTRAMK